MAAVRRDTKPKPIPKGAKIVSKPRKIPAKHEERGGVIYWTDRLGAKRSAVKKNAGEMITITAEWEGRRGGVKSAPVDYSGQVLLVLDKYYQADYWKGKERIRRSTGIADREAAQRQADKWEAEARLELRGVVSKSESRLREAGERPLPEHLEEFQRLKRTAGRSPDYVHRIGKHVGEFVDAAGWQSVHDITEESVTAYADEMSDDGLRTRTVGARLRSVKGFSRWLHRSGRMDHDPLAAIPIPDPKTDRAELRRMLLPDEWPALQRAALARPQYNGLTGSERRLLYWLAIETGLRAGELSALRRPDLRLAAEPPAVLAHASTTKNRKKAHLTISAALAAELAAYVDTRPKGSEVFPIAGERELARMLAKDLEQARSDWIDESKTKKERKQRERSDFLALENEASEKLVFHSLRHTCGAWLAMAGASVGEVQRRMRHSTPTLTLNTYGHELRSEIESAPDKIRSMMPKG